MLAEHIQAAEATKRIGSSRETVLGKYLNEREMKGRKEIHEPSGLMYGNAGTQTTH